MLEAKVMTYITESEVQKFIWRNTITRFEVPKAMVFNNGYRFDTDKVRNYYANQGIQIRFTTIARPQTNGQAESSNKYILNRLKKRLNDANGLSQPYSSLFGQLRRVLHERLLHAFLRL